MVDRKTYAEMFAAQEGKCAICGEAEVRLRADGEVRQLAVDHDHATGAIRKLLCDRCNMVLGLVNDDVPRLRAMIEYLCSFTQ